MKNLRNYLIVGIYFSYLLILIKLSLDAVNQFYLLIGLSPLTLYATIGFIRDREFRKQFIRASSIIIVFYLCYFLISSYNQQVFVRGITLFTIFLSHILISSYCIFKHPKLTEPKFTIFGFLIITTFIVFIPHYRVTGSLQLGSFYNLMDPSLITQTTVEGPLIAALLFLLSFYDLIFNKKYSILNILAVVFSTFVLLLFNRRGFIFSSAFSVGFYFIINRFKVPRLSYVVFIILFLPMYWTTIADFLSSLVSSPLFSSFIVRNDHSEMLTANGRSRGWVNILNLYYTFDSKYLFGYFGPIPDYIFLSTKENGRYEHAHNTLLQLFLDAGYFINAYFVIMLFRLFNAFAKRNRKDSTFKNFYYMIIIFLFVLASTETLIRQINFSNFIFCYALIGFSFINEANKEQRKFLLIRTEGSADNDIQEELSSIENKDRKYI